MTSAQTKPLLEVLSGRPVTPTPIWLMRQAGRYLAEYRELRAKAGDFMALCFTPAHAAEVTLQPIRRFGFDAAILFSDILVIPHALGQRLWFEEGEGPKLLRFGPQDFAKMNPATAAPALAPILETVARVKAELPPPVTLIGFAGAPWTVANYMVAGGSSSDSEDLRSFLATNPRDLDGLLETIVETTIAYLVGQVRAGADALQLFESWGGSIPAGFVERCSVKPMRRIIDGVQAQCPGIPFIVFPRGVGLHHPAYVATGANAIGVDYQTSIADVRRHLPAGMATQGNLDPVILASGGEVFEDAMTAILAQTRGTAHIFNLGHGILQRTPVAHVQRLVDRVRSTS